MSLVLSRGKINGGMCVEYGGWDMITVLFLAMNSRTSIDVWVGVLAWCKIHGWFFHNSGSFWRIASRNRRITLCKGLAIIMKENSEQKLHIWPNLTCFFRFWLFWTLPLRWLGFVTSYDILNEVERPQHLLSDVHVTLFYL